MDAIHEAFSKAIKEVVDSGRFGSQAEVARRLGLSRGAFNNKVSGRRGSTEEFRRSACKALGLDYEEIVSQAGYSHHTPFGGAIASGAADIETHHPAPAHQSGSDPPQCPPPDQEEDDKLPTPLQAIEMTKSVLASRTIYRGALLQNIKAFYKAVEGEQEMGEMKNKVTNLENMIETLTREFREFRREQQFAGGESPAQKREVQGN